MLFKRRISPMERTKPDLGIDKQIKKCVNKCIKNV